VKKFKIGSFRQKACAGGRRSHAPAPPRWNARSARVLGCGFQAVICQDRPNSIFSQLQGQKPKASGWVPPTKNPPRRCATPLWGDVLSTHQLTRKIPYRIPPGFPWMGRLFLHSDPRLFDSGLLSLSGASSRRLHLGAFSPVERSHPFPPGS
jgi:hypothetical protein